MNSTQISTQRIYKGDFPETSRGYYALTSPQWRRSFVYVLMDVAGRPLYVGMSRNPAHRFDRHRRTAWWPEVSTVAILQVDGEDREEVRLATLQIELETIHHIHPAYNVTGVIR